MTEPEDGDEDIEAEPDDPDAWRDACDDPCWPDMIAEPDDPDASE